MPTVNANPLICIVHTSFVSVEDLKALFAELVPAATVRNIVDDTLLPEVLANGGVTPRVRSRMVDYFRAAERAGADLVFNQCSSVGEAADVAACAIEAPVIKVDERMAEVACETGPRIGVVATLGTTLDPTCRLIERTAQRLNQEIRIERRLVEGAFDKLVGGDRAGHNRDVLDAIEALARGVDVVACAQGSMAAIVPELPELPAPVLTSPRLGVQSVADYFAAR